MAEAAHHRSHAIKIRNAQVIHGFVLLWLVLCLCLATFNQDLLPGKYFFDSGGIASRFGYVSGFVRNESFDNTALFYDMLLLSGSPRLTALVTSGIFSVFVFKSMSMPARLDRRVFHDLLLFAFTCATGAVYLAQYSKEATVMLIVFMFFGLSRTWKQQFIWMLVVCVYAEYFRSYWFLVLAFYLYYAVAFRFTKNIFLMFCSIALAFLILAILFQAVLGVDLAHYRYMVNDARTYDMNASTMIQPMLPTGGIGFEWLNAVAQFFLMFFPIPLLTGNPLYLVFFLIVASIGLRLLAISRLAIARKELNAGTREGRCLALVLSFVTIQSIFEPDYGSYIKHLTPMLPLVLFLMCWRPQTSTGRS